MEEFCANFTEDGSVGLYDKEVDDIYHSKFGAISEAYEKFILPSNIDDFLNVNNKIKILDICFGIGYNSKAFLNYFIKNSLEKSNCINSIDTDNISRGKTACNPKKTFEIILHGVDINEKLIKLSPFIKQNKNFKINNKDYYIRDEVNIILLKKIFEKYKSNYFTKDFSDFITNKSHKKFFSQKMIDLARKYQNRGYQTSKEHDLSTLLHNIYYEYVSISYKKALNVLKNNKIDIQLYADDARNFLTTSNEIYDYVFLDAFSPSKAPSLWTIEFFNELFNHTSDNCMILTYSNSAAIRNAFLKNNFYVGKIYNLSNKKFMGTIASKNKSLIEIPLNQFDLGLINTKSGICYHDENLSSQNFEIIQKRNLEVKNSTLISTSHFKKECQCNTMQL